MDFLADETGFVRVNLNTRHKLVDCLFTHLETNSDIVYFIFNSVFL